MPDDLTSHIVGQWRLRSSEAGRLGLGSLNQMAQIAVDICTGPGPEDRTIPLVRELASNYHHNLLSAESAMDAIVSFLL